MDTTTSAPAKFTFQEKIININKDLMGEAIELQQQELKNNVNLICQYFENEIQNQIKNVRILNELGQCFHYIDEEDIVMPNPLNKISITSKLLSTLQEKGIGYNDESEEFYLI